MDLVESETEYLIVDGSRCLRCSRETGRLEGTDALALMEQKNPSCLGIVYGVIGRVEFTSDGPSYLVIITDRKCIASHPLTGKPVYKIEKIAAIPLTTPGSLNADEQVKADLQLSPCPKHHHHGRVNGESNIVKPGVAAGYSLFQKGQQKMAKATTDSFKLMANKMNIRGISSGNKQSPVDVEAKERQRAERRLLLEFIRMFNESGSFYYCPGADITNSIQRLCVGKNGKCSSSEVQFDSRFVWNFYMLRDLMEQESRSSSVASPWIVPIIQGFIGVEECSITYGDNPLFGSPRGRVQSPETFHFKLMVVSRRSIHRAGTRYIKRGIDGDGHCANYVETEQILLVENAGSHVAAFVQVRGSVPVYWSQPGFKYRPPPKLDKSKMESELAFRRHFDDQLRLYPSIVIVNLVEQIGREKVLSDAYVDHVLDLDLENVTYVAFDFHEHCRGLKFENIALLTTTLEEQLIQQIGFCWVDGGIENCIQRGVCRVNCVDCLDRTNVVQAALGRTMLEIQLRKFGILPPEEVLPLSVLRSFQCLWAANGDAISRQYAGTVALKGDFTRTGQRNFAGMMKDGYNSANRYYLCHIKDAQRQAAIDALLGRRTVQNEQDLENILKSKLESGTTQDEASWLKEKDEQLRLFVRDCERLVVPDGEVILGSWAFINADPGTGSEDEEDMDTCVVLTRQAYYVADYDEDLDKFVDCQRILLTEIQKIETGPMTVAAVLGVPKMKATCLRIHYQLGDESKEEYFHVWRSGSTRLFNNLAIAIKSTDEADEYMKAVAEQFHVALELIDRPVHVVHALKLERKRSRIPPAKLASRKNGNTAMFLSSVSGGMKSFGNRFSAAFNYQGKRGTRLFQLGSGRGKNMDTGNKRPVPPLPLIVQQDIPSTKWHVGPFVDGNAGLLFGNCTAEAHPKTVPTLRRHQSDGDFRDSNKNHLDTSTGITPESRCNSAAISIGQVSPLMLSPRDCHSSTGQPLLAPSSQNMKTSHSEVCFRPSEDPASAQRTLASSQTALDNANQKPQPALGLKFPLLFRRNTEDPAKLGQKRKFVQFQERIQKSRTKFLLL